jgi:hypothetical protein
LFFNEPYPAGFNEPDPAGLASPAQVTSELPDFTGFF